MSEKTLAWPSTRPVSPIIGRMVNRPLEEIMRACGQYDTRRRYADNAANRAQGYLELERTEWIENLEALVAAGEVTLAWK